jgi:hypothetical protein
MIKMHLCDIFDCTCLCDNCWTSLLLLWTVYVGRTMQLFCNNIVREKVTTARIRVADTVSSKSKMLDITTGQAIIYVFYC